MVVSVSCTANKKRMRFNQGRSVPLFRKRVVALGIVFLRHDLAGDMVTPLVPIVVATMGSGPRRWG